MMPEIAFVVGGWRVGMSAHAVFVMLAACAGVLLAAWRARQPAVVLTWAPALVAAAVGGADALYRALHGGESGGLSSMGGVAAVAAIALAAARGSPRRFADLADAVAPAGIAALGIGRIGCFLAGCCWGRPTDLPWGVVFPELGPPARHPLQLYSAALDLSLAGMLLASGGPPGTTAARAALALGVLRLLLETVRDPAAADPSIAGVGTAPMGALLLVVAGLVATVRLRRSRPPVCA
jgi:prolipoprotein diacylglyceryltransferase